jgi:hypothetical protein
MFRMHTRHKFEHLFQDRCSLFAGKMCSDLTAVLLFLLGEREEGDNETDRGNGEGAEVGSTLDRGLAFAVFTVLVVKRMCLGTGNWAVFLAMLPPSFAFLLLRVRP